MASRAWHICLIATFLAGSTWGVVVAVVAPDIIGSHGAIYSEAANAWLTGGNPWHVGPPDVVFAGPPTMLLPFAPSAFLPWDAARAVWVAVDLAAAIVILRRLRLPPYWLAFPPLLGAIILGHPEPLVLALLVLGGPRLSGLAIAVKPYAALPLIAERRWAAIGSGAVVCALSLVVLPWEQFLAELPHISATLARQSHGDSVFGQPVFMAVAVAALAALGPRRGLWLTVPVLWPYAQPIYKTMTIPALTPITAVAWALPFPGATLAGLVLEAVLVQLDRRRRMPPWVREGIAPIMTTSAAARPTRTTPSLGVAK